MLTLDFRVFENESQETVYDCVAKESVSDVLNGFNSTVFAYGQVRNERLFDFFPLFFDF